MANESIEVLEVFDKLETSCSKTYNNLVNEYLEIRAGRANPHVLDKVLVD